MRHVQAADDSVKTDSGTTEQMERMRDLSGLKVCNKLLYMLLISYRIPRVLLCLIALAAKLDVFTQYGGNPRTCVEHPFLLLFRAEAAAHLQQGFGCL